MAVTSVVVHPNTKIYVLQCCKGETGGMELLHQVVYHLRTDLGIDAYLYWPYDPEFNYIAPVYEKYNNPVVYAVEDTDNNILLFPEAYWIHVHVKKHKAICKIMWWMSVDNYYISMLLKTNLTYAAQGLVNRICGYLGKEPVYDLSLSIQRLIPQLSKSLCSDKMVRQAQYHLCQSHYAHNFLESAGISTDRLGYLSDYLAEAFLTVETPLSAKKNIVAYNPLKGFKFTKQIIKAGFGITFVPLVNMPREQIVETLQSAKVYIDFGHHPGKDRIPREAAILGCCVITGKRGSAAFYEDVSIPEEFKCDDTEDGIHKVIHLIRDCFDDYQGQCNSFRRYRRIIEEERSRFTADLKKIFVVRTGVSQSLPIDSDPAAVVD
jgi:hypothetical protein